MSNILAGVPDIFESDQAMSDSQWQSGSLYVIDMGNFTSSFTFHAVTVKWNIDLT